MLRRTHGHGHAAAGDEVGGLAAAAEVLGGGGVPGGGIQALLASAGVISHQGLITGLPSISSGPVPSRADGPELIRCRMPFSARPVRLVTGDALDGLRAPVSAHIGEDLGSAGQQVTEQHAGAVE